MPVKNLLITTGIFAFSFGIRTLIDFIQLIDPDMFVNLQDNSCFNNTAGWALLVFFMHCFGEVLPLSVLFWVQLKTNKGRKTANSRASTVSKREPTLVKQTSITQVTSEAGDRDHRITELETEGGRQTLRITTSNPADTTDLNPHTCGFNESGFNLVGEDEAGGMPNSPNQGNKIVNINNLGNYMGNEYR